LESALNFSLTEQQRGVRESVRTMTQAEIVPRIAHLDRAFPDVVKILADHRMMGMTVPQEYGGSGKDEVSHVLALMEVSRESAAVGGVLAWNNSLYCFPLLKCGTVEQKRKFLFPCATGEKTGSFALIGSTFSGTNRFTALTTAGEGLVNGEGSFFPRGVSFGIVPALFQQDDCPAALIVDLERAEGLRRGETLEQGGIFFSGIAEAVFDNRRVEVGDLMAGRDRGQVLLQSTLREAWMAVGALAAGIGEGSLKEALSAVEREEGRGSISQSVEWKLADMAVETEAARLFVLKAAWLKDQGKNYEKEAASAKIFASGAAVKASCQSLEILGDRNPGRRPLMERRLRDAEMCRVYYGTSGEAGFVVADHVIGQARVTGF
jgi:alkylation response protein AidB-like acyl-CoA dehydrogenase